MTASDSSGRRCRIVIDGESVEVERGTNLLAALDAAGRLAADGAADDVPGHFAIPHFCWHPKLSVDGSCRMCSVEIAEDGASGDVDGEGSTLAIACQTPVREGLVIRTETKAVRDAREAVMEFLLLNHPLDCPICDQAGECRLQDFSVAHGAQTARSREPRRALAKRVALGPTIVLDQERCILCRRCVRFCREITGTGELGVVGRGDTGVIEAFPEQPLDNPYAMNVADVCPVGALTTRDFRFKRRVWDLRPVETVCAGCARGCNVFADVYEDEIARQRPRRNDAVNETWMCDAGRLLHHRGNADDRLREAKVGIEDDARPVTSDAAIEHAASRLAALVSAKGAGVVAVVASAHATNEALFVLRRLLQGLGIEGAGLALRRGEADGLLLHAERAPNAAGARALGFAEESALLERVRGGGVDGLLIAGPDGLEGTGLDLATLARLDTVIWLATHVAPLASVAQVVVPIRTPFETEGTIVNAGGRVQRLRAVVPAPEGVLAEGDVLCRLARALGLAGFDGAWDPSRASRELADAHPAFAGCDFARVGSLGWPLGRSAGA